MELSRIRFLMAQGTGYGTEAVAPQVPRNHCSNNYERTILLNGSRASALEQPSLPLIQNVPLAALKYVK